MLRNEEELKSRLKDDPELRTALKSAKVKTPQSQIRLINAFDNIIGSAHKDLSLITIMADTQRVMEELASSISHAASELRESAESLMNAANKQDLRLEQTRFAPPPTVKDEKSAVAEEAAAQKGETPGLVND